ncbi:hypothetical protein CHARACLAT_032373 [Characodon lateralis]|uniref:Uncharacterized protein n=1 Tax=Characodon lateralis TaxID=208331 RepID=A0ABU7DXK1_9TELE|nr:hypothetical protein [Characodon lateralis]
MPAECEESSFLLTGAAPFSVTILLIVAMIKWIDSYLQDYNLAPLCQTERINTCTKLTFSSMQDYSTRGK